MGINKDQQYLAGAHAKIAVEGSVVQLGDTADLITKQLAAAGNPKHYATEVWITVETNPIYFTLDGTDPATDGSAGHSWGTGTNDDNVLKIRGWHNINNFKCIRQSTNNASIKVTAFFNGNGGWS